MIERQMQEDGHRIWGYVIYRTSYSSEDDWTDFRRRLRYHVEDTFKYYNGQDTFELFTLIFSDPTLFDRADTPEDDSGGEEVRMGRSPHSQFCVQVDAAALNSVVYDDPAPRSTLRRRAW